MPKVQKTTRVTKATLEAANADLKDQVKYHKGLADTRSYQNQEDSRRIAVLEKDNQWLKQIIQRMLDNEHKRI